MPDRTSHPHGTISWTDLATTDQDSAKEFYGRLLGWEYDDQPAGEGVIYSMAKVRGRAAAAISPQQPDETTAGIPPHWNVYVTVDDVDAASAAAGEHGGTVLAGPFDVLDVGRMAVIADPSSAVLCLWQAKSSIGAEVVNEPGAMSWADTASTDPEAAQAFYAALLGWSFQQMSEEPPYWVIFNGERSNGGMTAPPPGVPSNWFPYFVVEDIDAAIETATAAGGNPFVGPMDVPNGGRFVLIMDPQGAAFGLLSGEMDD
jgi:predicted enzyme related to lactoylglutathione lyase